MALKELNGVSLTPDKQVGVIVKKNNVQKVEDILGVKNLYKPKGLPGVYVIHFEKDNILYIGQSKNVSIELSRLQSSYVRQLALRKAFETNKPDMSFYAVLQGPGWNNKDDRVKVENFLIQKAGNKCINVLGNPNIKKQNLKQDPRIKQPKFIPLTDSWSQFGLSYPNLPFPSSGGWIYLFLHKDTGNFYIGCSSLVKYRNQTNIQRLISRHTYNIKSYQKLQLSGLTGSKSYNRIIKDINLFGSQFYYSVIFNAGNINRKDLEMVEKKMRKDATIKYPHRLYNPLSKEEEVILRNYTLRSTKLIPPKVTFEQVRDARLPNLPDRFSYPVIYKGKWYNTIKDLNREINVPVSTIKTRCLNFHFPEYIWLRDTSGKVLPTTDEIQRKIGEFNVIVELAPLYYSSYIYKPQRLTFEKWLKKLFPKGIFPKG